MTHSNSMARGVCRGLAVAVLAMAPWAIPGPAAAQNALDDQIDSGREIFLTAAGVGCAACHGAYGEGDVGIGPYARGVTAEAIRSAVETIPQMAFLQASVGESEVQDLAAFTQWLGGLQLIKTLAKRGRFLPETAAVRPNTQVQLVVTNTSRFPRTFASEDMGIDEITVAGRESAEFVWQAPAEEGSFSLICVDCRIADQQLSITVSEAASAFIPASAPPVPVAVASVPETPGEPERDMRLVEQGLEIFQTAGEVGCSACHGPYAEGDVGIGPYNRGFDEAAIRTALVAVDVMRFLRNELSELQIEQIAAYYDWLGDLQLLKARVIRGEFFPARIEVAPGTQIQLVVFNRGRAPAAFASANMGIQPFVLSGLEEVDLVWTAPDAEGDFTLSCVDCVTLGEDLTIAVRD